MTEETRDTLQRQVAEIVARIPEGRVTTYGAIAAAIGRPRAARLVGWALSRIDGEELPCHRVVDRHGNLSGGWAFGHPEVMRQRLTDDGVTFVAPYQVDLARHFWSPQGEPPPTACTISSTSPGSMTIEP